MIFTQHLQLCLCFLGAHTASWPVRLFSLTSPVQHLCLIKQRQNKDAQALVQSSAFFFRSSLIKPGPVFMVSGSVYIVFLDKCQPMTFFELIYSPQKADAAFVRLCSLVRWSFTAIILYISPLTRTCVDACDLSLWQTQYNFLCWQNYVLRKIYWDENSNSQSVPIYPPD